MSNPVPEGWKVTPLENILYRPLAYGVLKPGENVKNGVPVVRIQDIRGNRLNFDGLYRISSELHREFRRTKLNEGDLIISLVGTIGKTFVVPASLQDANVTRAFGVIGVQEAVSPEYVTQWLNSDSSQQWIQDQSQGNAQKVLNLGALKQFPLQLPPLPEQQKITAILSSVDDVIEKTRAQIDKLKDLKTGMMQELLTKGIGSGGVPHTEFKDSPLGRIPSSWNVRSLGALSSFVTSGSRGWAQYYSNSGAIFIRIGNLTREHINLRFDDTVYVTPPASAEGKRTQVTIGDVLISITADLGVIGVVNESIGEAFVNQHISLVRLNEPVLARWVGHFLAFENSQKQFIANNDAGAKAGLNLTAIRKTLVAIPAKEEREKIVASLDSVDKDVSLQRDRLQRLMNLKRALMQDLLTGKVRVKVDQKESAVA